MSLLLIIDEPGCVFKFDMFGKGCYPVPRDDLRIRILGRCRAEVVEGGEDASEVLVVEAESGRVGACEGFGDGACVYDESVGKVEGDLFSGFL